jgi:hypothetical protein
MNPSRRYRKLPYQKEVSKAETFCTEIGEYVFCTRDCLNCDNFKESTKREYGKNYP